jgi:hypothetical protein
MIEIPAGAFQLAPYPVTREVYRAVRGEAPASSAEQLAPVTEISWRVPCSSATSSPARRGSSPATRWTTTPMRKKCPATGRPTEIASRRRLRVGVRVQSELRRRPLRRAGRDHLVRRKLRRRGAWRCDQGAEQLGSVRHDRQRVGVVLGPLHPSIYGPYRVFLGGGWSDPPRGCRASCRRKSHPTFGRPGLPPRPITSRRHTPSWSWRRHDQAVAPTAWAAPAPPVATPARDGTDRRS